MQNRSRRSIGFRPHNELIYRLYNFVAALFLLIAILPVMLAISLVLIATQGLSIFYVGPRLGRNEKVFKIIKFRTLCTAKAREITKDRTLPKDSKIETPFGGFLRETRLDELPQLINVLVGDMNICGPRPVRPEIAQIERARIPFYEARFTVRPGLVGPTQAYFGHSASKRLRARMNKFLVQRDVDIVAELGLLGVIGTSMVRKSFSKIGRRLLMVWRADAAREGQTVPRYDIWLTSENDHFEARISHVGLRRVSIPGWTGQRGQGRLALHVRLSSGKLRKAWIHLSETEKEGVYAYTAATQIGEYIIERYALQMVVVPPKLKTLPRLQPHVAQVGLPSMTLHPEHE